MIYFLVPEVRLSLLKYSGRGLVRVEIRVSMQMTHIASILALRIQSARGSAYHEPKPPPSSPTMCSYLLLAYSKQFSTNHIE